MLVAWTKTYAEEKGKMEQEKVSDIILEFCSETSFHAIKFFTKDGLHPYKRIFWILCWITSLTSCVYIITINVSEYQTTSTMTTIHSTTYPIKRLSFPSATFCNFNYIMKNRNPPNQQEVLGRIQFQDAQWKKIVSAVYENLFGDDPVTTNITLESNEVVCFIKESAQRCEDMIIFCLWRGLHDCSQHFHQVPTKFGFCCVYNQLLGRTINYTETTCPGELQSTEEKERKMTKIAPNQTQESAGVLSPGLKRGLTVVLDAQTDEYSYNTFHSTGFQLHLQEPGQPGLSEETIVLTPGRESFVSITAHSTFTTKAALDLRPQNRRCYKSSENNGRTHNGCVLEHEANYTFEICKCKDFHLPGNESICFKRDDIHCMTESKEKWDIDLNQQGIMDSVCLPRCNKTWYVATPSYANFPSTNLIDSWLGMRFLLPLLGKLCKEGRVQLHFEQLRNNSSGTTLSKEEVKKVCGITEAKELENTMDEFPALLEFLMKYIEDNVAVGHVFFGHSVSTLYKRDVVTTPSQIVANIGGLLGLFLGFSLLSGAEIIFYIFEILSSLGTSIFKKASVVHVDRKIKDGSR